MEAGEIALKPMSSAPRDGRSVVLVWRDYGGVALARYGEHIREELSGINSWFYHDFSDEIGGDELWAGWLCAPDFPGWEAK